MPKKDVNQVAFSVVRQATGELVAVPETVKAKSGRKGGLVGGDARAASLTPKKRKAIAKKAAKARWKER